MEASPYAATVMPAMAPAATSKGLSWLGFPGQVNSVPDRRAT